VESVSVLADPVRPKTKTVPVAVYNFISYGKIDWAGIGAAATLIVLPVSIFAFFVAAHHRARTGLWAP